MKSDEGDDLEDIEVDETEGQETTEILHGLSQTFDPYAYEGSFQWPSFGKTTEIGEISAFQPIGRKQIKVTHKRPSYENFSDSGESGDETKSASQLIPEELHEQLRTQSWVDTMNNDEEAVCYKCTGKHAIDQPCCEPETVEAQKAMVTRTR